MIETEIIKPQPGPQTMLLACEADIAIYGGCLLYTSDAADE